MLWGAGCHLLRAQEAHSRISDAEIMEAHCVLLFVPQPLVSAEDVQSSRVLYSGAAVARQPAPRRCHKTASWHIEALIGTEVRYGGGGLGEGKGARPQRQTSTPVGMPCSGLAATT